jgi:hypothetical protein
VKLEETLKMNIKGNYIRVIIIPLILLTILNTSVFSQGTDSRRTTARKDKFYIGILLNPLKTNIVNEKVSVGYPLKYEKGNSLNLAVDFGYFFSKIVGMSLGIGYGSYSSELSMDYYTSKYQTTDSENENFEMRITGTSIVENQKISFLSIPANLILRLPASRNFGFFLKGGISFDIPIDKTYKGSGTFSYDGYYSVYPVLLQDLPAYGFPSNLNTISSGNLQIKSLNSDLSLSGGIYFFINETVQFDIGVHFIKSLSNISTYEPDSNFRLTSKANELNSFMAGSTNTGLQALGMSLGLKFYFR